MNSWSTKFPDVDPRGIEPRKPSAKFDFEDHLRAHIAFDYSKHAINSI